MKILRVITRLNIGGPARQVCFLQKAFNDKQDTSYLIYGKLDEGEGDFSPLLEESSNTIYFPSLTRPIQLFLDTITLIKLIAWLNKHPIDILHTHTAKAGLLARLAAWFCNVSFRRFSSHPKIKIIHTYHGHVFSGYFSKTKTKMIKSIERFLYKRSDKVITLNQTLRNEIQSHLSISSDKFKIIPLGLNLETFYKLNKTSFFSETFHQNHQCLWIGWVGRLVSIKNPFRFLDICEQMHQRESERLRFVLVGDGSLREDLEKEIHKRNLEGIVFILGWAKDLKEVYSGLDFFMNTSDNEGTPVAALEALAAGIPSALSDVGGTRDATPQSEHIWIFQPDNYSQHIDSWVQTVIAQRRLDVQLSSDIVEKFSQEKLFRSIQNLYLDLLAENNDAR